MSDEVPPSPSDRDPLSIACELVGRFQYHFSKIEAALNQGIARVLDLNDITKDIVCANLDFIKKVAIVKTAITVQFVDTDGSLSDILDRAAGINNPDRQFVIHSTFEPFGKDGVRFIRITTKEGQLHRQPQDWDFNKFRCLFTRMDSITEDIIKRLVPALTPYTPSLDFSDHRNSSLYFALI